MIQGILNKVIKNFLVLLGVTFLTFLLLHTTSTDVVDQMENYSGGVLSEIVKEEIRTELGLDQPLIIQYSRWMAGILRGDMGVSYVSGESVFSLFKAKLPATFKLAASALAVTLLLAVPLGLLMAVHRNKGVDYILRGGSFIGNALPNFFVAFLLMDFFCLKLKVLPVMAKGQTFKEMLLPMLTLVVAMTAKYMRQIRTILLEELEKDYVVGARARGIKEKVIICKSIFKRGTLTMLPLLSLSLGSLLGGTAIIESIFMWDGVGKMAVDAITMKDYPVIQAYVVWMTFIYSLINLGTDLLQYKLDPRLRLGEDK